MSRHSRPFNVRMERYVSPYVSFLSVNRQILFFFFSLSHFSGRKMTEEKKEKERKNEEKGENPPRARMWEQYHRGELKRFIITHCVQYYRRKTIRPFD